MGFFRGLLFRPFTSTYDSLSGMGSRMGSRVAELKRVRQMQLEDYREREKLQKLDGQFTDEDLMSMPAAAIKCDAQRFKALYLQNDWDEESLAKRLRSVIWRKRISGLVAIFSFFGGLLVMWALPVWSMLILTPGLLLCSAVFIGRLFLDGVYQAQIESRRLISGREYLAREDLFRHLVS